jgi:ABC-type sugar transport system permease subunit
MIKKAGEMRKRSLGVRLWRGRVAYLMLLPTFVMLGIFLYYPAFMGLYRSLFKWSAGAEAAFIGLDNFVTLFTKDKVFGWPPGISFRRWRSPSAWRF